MKQAYEFHNSFFLSRLEYLHYEYINIYLLLCETEELPLLMPFQRAYRTYRDSMALTYLRALIIICYPYQSSMNNERAYSNSRFKDEFGGK